MTVQAPKTTLQQRLVRIYNIPPNVTFHCPKRVALTNTQTFGQLLSWEPTKDGDKCPASGAELLESIVLAQKEIERIQAAIDNMVSIMEQQDAEHDAVAHPCAIAKADQQGGADA